jgi:tRNA A58 N-methylase Trm61
MQHLTLDKLPAKILAKFDVENMFMVSRIIIAAERLQLFRKLEDKKCSMESIQKLLRVRSKYLGYFLDALVSLGLLKKDKNGYANTRLAHKYFIKERSVYWTKQFSAECVETFKEMTALEEVLKSSKDVRDILGKDSKNYLDEMTEHSRQANDFTRMLFHYHQSDAKALAKNINLRGFSKVLDAGGGSGVMSMGLVRRFSHLHVTVLDIEPVCRVARKIIKEEGLTDRIDTIAGDITEALPPGFDVVMFCDVGRLSQRMLANAFRCLPAQGMIVLVDRFASQDGTEPLDRLLHQFTTSSFSMATRMELMDLLRTVGFGAVKNKKLYRDVYLITGRKPLR